MDFFQVLSLWKDWRYQKALNIPKQFLVCCHGNWLLGFKYKIVLSRRPKNMGKEISYVSDFCASVSRGSWSVFWMKWFFWSIFPSHAVHGHSSAIKKDKSFCLWSLKKDSAFKWKSNWFKTHILLILITSEKIMQFEPVVLEIFWPGTPKMTFREKFNFILNKTWNPAF